MPLPDITNSKVLVTGGAGFIGSHLVDALRGMGSKVWILDNLSTGKKENIDHSVGHIEFIEGDIRDITTCQRACENIEYIFHQAALGSVPRSIQDPSTSISVNVTGTVNVFTAARDQGALRVIYASSSSVYGNSQKLPRREGQEGMPISPYALSKMMDEQLASIFSKIYDMEFIGLRYFNVYGPRQDPNGPYAAVVPQFLKAALEGTDPKIYGDGEQTRDFMFVQDVVRANMLAAGAPKNACGSFYNVGSGKAVSINELARRIAELSGRDWQPIYLPPREGDVKISLADIRSATEALGFESAYDLSKGLSESFLAMKP